MKKILFICDVRNATFGIDARGIVYKNYLEKNGWRCYFVSCTNHEDLINLPDSIKVPYKTEDEIIQLAQKCSIVYFIKIINENLVWKVHNYSKAILLYDFYDILWKSKKHEFNAILDLVDVLITEGTYLCDFLSRYHKPVFEIKSACVYEQYHGYKRRKDKIIIGWLGSQSTFSAIYNVKDALEAIGKKRSDVELRIVGAEGKNIVFKNIKVSYKAIYNHQEMINELSDFDIGIFPPPLDEFDYLVRGPHKGVRYMGAGKPAVFLDSGDCKLFVKDMENAVLYKDEKEFIDKILRLIEDEELSRNIGKSGYDTVYQMYSLESCEKSLLNILEAIHFLYFPRFHL